MELYKKYRPAALDEVIGQKAAVATLRSMLKGGKVPHVILFSGPSGCGKTTLARIIAKHPLMGCEDMDIVEVNSSSYRGVDSIRDLSRQSELCPIGKNRVWILDEAHKLTSDAQHAALKMLEDTPSKSYFFLCTTNPEKLIRPIKTRATEIVCAKLNAEDLAVVLAAAAEKEGIEIEESQAMDIVDVCDGSARAALVILDRLQHIPAEEWAQVIQAGAIETAEVIELCRALLAKRPWKNVAAILRGIEADPESVRWAVLGYGGSVLMKKPDLVAYLMIRAFSEPFYETKKAGLVAACFEVINGQ